MRCIRLIVVHCRGQAGLQSQLLRGLIDYWAPFFYCAARPERQPNVKALALQEPYLPNCGSLYTADTLPIRSMQKLRLTLVIFPGVAQGFSLPTSAVAARVLNRTHRTPIGSSGPCSIFAVTNTGRSALAQGYMNAIVLYTSPTGERHVAKA